MYNDSFSQYYSEYLDQTYDCIDRIVLNAYNPFLQSGGGFRTWWRILNGSDDTLDDTHLMRFAGHFARRVKAFAEKNEIPLIDSTKIERKDNEYQQYLPEKAGFTGLFCIFFNRAAASVLKVERYGNGGINVKRKDPWPYVNMYAFHIIDEEWGHIIIRFCPHPPFNAMIILNGHEYVEREARKCGISFTKEDNCFTRIPNAAALTRIADSMTSSDGGVGRLAGVCERWIYSTCLCFALELADQQRAGFQYAYSVFQAEYSRNLLFTRGTVLDKLFDGVIERTRTSLDIRSLKTIFGFKKRPHNRDRHGKRPRVEIVVEKPVYNLTVFKVHFGRLTVKLYSKGERVLRIEAIVHNTAELRCGRSLQKFPAIIARLAAIVEQFMSKLHCVDVSFTNAQTVESWHRPGMLGEKKTAGIDINEPRMHAAMSALIALSIYPDGVSAPLFAQKMREILGIGPAAYSNRQAAYDLKKFRGKGALVKIDKKRAYRVNDDALRAMVAYIVLHDKVILPILGACNAAVQQPPSAGIEQHIMQVKNEMQHIFNHYRLAA